MDTIHAYMFVQVFPQASTMVDKLQESLQFYEEMSKTEEQSSSPQRSGNSEKSKHSSKEEESHKVSHFVQVAISNSSPPLIVATAGILALVKHSSIQLYPSNKVLMYFPNHKEPANLMFTFHTHCQLGDNSYSVVSYIHLCKGCYNCWVLCSEVSHCFYLPQGDQQSFGVDHTRTNGTTKL